ncbi:MAG: dCTP deaminase [Cyanobacteria bacterium P01_D01_bin.123]
MLKNDLWIIQQAEAGMIAPFEAALIRQVEVLGKPAFGTVRQVLSYGLSSYGYDIRLSPADFRIFRHIPGTVVDPKRFNHDNLEPTRLHVDECGEFFILPAHSYGLGVSVERLEVPPTITIISIGKSTYARCGIIANLTPAEASWRGHLTLEFSNASSADCRIYANEGVVQLLFLEGEPCSTTYADRAGKYQDQPQQVVVAKV